MSRPSGYSEKIADKICERLGNGESLRSICRDADMPSTPAVFRWLEKHEGFRNQYARAREFQADSLFDEILEIVDDGRNDWMEKVGADGEKAGWRENVEAMRRSQLRMDARKWMAGKLRPKVYGDVLRQELTGKDGGAIKVSNDGFAAFAAGLDAIGLAKASGALETQGLAGDGAAEADCPR